MIESFEQECFNLDYSLAKYILPRLLYFKNWVTKYGCPVDLEMEEWNEVIDEIVWAFMYVQNGYFKSTDFVIEDVNIEFDSKSDNGFVYSTVNLVYKEGFTDEDYNAAKIKDAANLVKCQQGLNLFSKYYTSLWN